jgi:hypothetical protein
MHQLSCQALALLELLVEIELPRPGWGPARRSPVGRTPALIPCARQRALSRENTNTVAIAPGQLSPSSCIASSAGATRIGSGSAARSGNADTDVSRQAGCARGSCHRPGARRRRCRARRARAHPPPRTGDGACPRAARPAYPPYPTRAPVRVSRGATEAYSRRRGARAPWPSRNRRRAARARGARPRRACSGRSQGGSGGARSARG